MLPVTFHWIVCCINPGPAGNHLTGSHFRVNTQGRTRVGRGPPEGCGLMGSGEASARLPAELVERTPLAGSCPPTRPGPYGFPRVPGIPSRKQGHRRELHVWFFAPRPGVHISVKGAGFLFSLHAVAWPTRGKARCSAGRVVGGALSSTALFAWKHCAFTEQFSPTHSVLPELKSPKALPGISWRACHCNKCL